MKTRTKFIILVVLVHAVLTLLNILLLQQYPYFFLAAECVTGLSVLLCINLVRSFIRPLELIMAGIESIREKDFSVRLVKVGHYEIDHLITVYNKMLDQLKAEGVAQQERNLLLDKLIHASPAGILLLDYQQRVSVVNPAAVRSLQTNLQNLRQHSLSEMDGALARALQELETDIPGIIHVGTRVYKCTKAGFINQGFFNHFILIEELTEEILKMERSAYEKVIKIMSHEINNSIGAINSILHSCLNYKAQLHAGDQADYEEAMTVAIGRNEKLCKSMSDLATVVSLPVPVKYNCDVNGLLRSVHVLLYHTFQHKSINWVWELDPMPVIVALDANQFELLLINVIKNAIEAIPETGSIIVKTSNAKGELAISDTGTGIVPEDEGRIFSPFFSNKKNGKGVGLTLCRDILSNHGFDFSLRSHHSLTTFLIHFPQS